MYRIYKLIKLLDFILVYTYHFFTAFHLSLIFLLSTSLQRRVFSFSKNWLTLQSKHFLYPIHCAMTHNTCNIHSGDNRRLWWTKSNFSKVLFWLQWEKTPWRILSTETNSGYRNYSWLQARGQQHDQYSYPQLAEPLSLCKTSTASQETWLRRHAIVIQMYTVCTDTNAKTGMFHQPRKRKCQQNECQFVGLYKDVTLYYRFSCVLRTYSNLQMCYVIDCRLKVPNYGLKGVRVCVYL